MVKSISFKGVEKLCQQLAAAANTGNSAVVDRIVAQGVQQRVLDSSSLPLIVQQLATRHRSWVAALRTLESGQLDRLGVRRDPNIWRTIDTALPKGDKACQEAVHARLRTVYGSALSTTPTSRLVGRSSK